MLLIILGSRPAGVELHDACPPQGHKPDSDLHDENSRIVASDRPLRSDPSPPFSTPVAKAAPSTG
jgi:hypothetical protein